MTRGGYSRVERLGEQIARELATLIDREVRDPAVDRVTVSGVEVARDLAHAKVYVTPATGSDVQATLEGLNRAAAFLRRRLGEHIRVRSMPALHFVYDRTLDEANRIDALLAAAPPAPARKQEEDD